MPVRCTFILDTQPTSTFYCPGIGSMTAFSGKGRGRDNPNDTDEEDGGAIPNGTSYLIDRQSGGLFGPARDDYDAHGYVTANRTKWFTLWNPNTGDTTIVNGHKRGAFRPHPVGPLRMSEGCIAVVSPIDFDRLEKFLRTQKPDLPAPGATARAYGTVDVR